ncbi:hypothetical protein [Neorhizobium sp. T25_27]|uniref:hypothetical protein n=1 Tax=Neorhizobium sp. T25_27 TaxID=2093831 RepID=UPI00155F25D5|nr:hypothetical protein [Neorhizobium sp. T25_27]
MERDRFVHDPRILKTKPGQQEDGSIVVTGCADSGYHFVNDPKGYPSNSRRPLAAAALRKARKASLSVTAVSAVTNLLMLVGPLFMMQVYGRVLTSRSIP